MVMTDSETGSSELKYTKKYGIYNSRENLATSQCITTGVFQVI